jgi:hypothetical protein
LSPTVWATFRGSGILSGQGDLTHLSAADGKSSALFLLPLKANQLLAFPAMSPKGSNQKETPHKVERNISPDDIRHKLLERDRQIASDTRSPSEIHLGDPMRHQSALFQRINEAKK